MKDYYLLTTQGKSRRLRQLAEAALAHYDLDIIRIRLLSNETNGIFRLDTADGSKFVLRVCLAGDIGHSPAEIRSEMMWLDAIRRDTDLMVPAPLCNRSGEYVTTTAVPGVPEARHCVIFSWIPGRDIATCLTESNLEAWGEFTARLHLHGADFKPPSDFSIVSYDRVFPFDQPVVLFDKANREFMPPERRRLFDAGVARVQTAINRFQASGEPMRVLHGDLHQWNVRVARGRIAAFDFEDLMWGWPIQDIATTLYYMHGHREFADHLAAFRRGYTRHLEWPERIPGELDTFMINRALVLANDILVKAEWSVEATWYFPRAERRVQALLDGEPFLLERNN